MAPPHVAFPPMQKRQRPDCIFSELNTQPYLYPCLRFARTPRGGQRKTRGRAVRYSFLVGLFHSLLHTGLSRRTASAIWRHSRSAPGAFGACRDRS